MIAAAGICLMYTFGYFLAAFMFIGIVHCIISPLCYWRQRAADIKFQELQSADGIEVEKAETEVDGKAKKEKSADSIAAVEVPMWETKVLNFKDLFGSKFFTMAMVSFIRFQMSFFFVLVILMPMIISYHGLTPDKAVIAYFVAPVSYVILLPVIEWARDGGHLQKRTMILVGQGIEAFGLLVMTGDLTWMGRGYAIFCVGLGCVCMGVSQCILTAVIIPEMNDAVCALPEGHKYDKEAVSVYISNMNMIIIAICQGVGFFVGCFIGIGWSYNFAFWGSSALTVVIILVQTMVYYISCGSKAAAEKKNDEDPETQALLKSTA